MDFVDLLLSTIALLFMNIHCQHASQEGQNSLVIMQKMIICL